MLTLEVAKQISKPGEAHLIMPHPTAKVCKCGHAKSIHARVFANPKPGTPCNFPYYKCKGYRSARIRARRKAS